MLNLTLGEKLMLLRRRKNVSQEEIAEYLNINQSNIPNYENDKYKPNMNLLIKLAQFHGVSLDFLVLNPTDTQGELDQELVDIIKSANNLNPDQKSLVKSILKSCIEQIQRGK